MLNNVSTGFVFKKFSHLELLLLEFPCLMVSLLPPSPILMMVDLCCCCCCCASASSSSEEEENGGEVDRAGRRGTEL